MRVSLVALGLALYAPGPAGLHAQNIAVTGVDTPALSVCDQAMTSVMAAHGVPGGVLAISRNGKLVFAHGYGTLDSGGQAQVQPDSLFRIASLSKQLTAVSILRMWDQGLIDLDKSAFSYLPDIQPLPGKQADPRVPRITVRNLLQHSGGWDASKSGDPFDTPLAIAKVLGKPSPPSSTDVIRVMLGRPLDFDPGTQYAYSNLGYTVLGRIIEHVSGMNYEQYVRQVLAPLGIERMRIGNTLPAGRLPGEASYTSTGTTPSIFPYGARTVPWPYGGWYLEGQDSNSGWVASAPDLIKFWNAIDGRRGGPLLSAAAIAQLTARPSIPAWANSSYWYGMGVNVVPTSSGAYWWADGYLDGTRALASRQRTSLNWVMIFNSDADTDYLQEVDSVLSDSLPSITNWPSTDLFPSLATPNTNRPAIQTQDGVLNGASFQRGFAAGSWFSILGINLAAAARAWTAADFQGATLPLSLDGVTVTMGGHPAPVYYISPTQINVQVPAGLAAGAVAVEVHRNGITSGPALGELRQSAPALFTYSAAGELFAAAVFNDGSIAGDPLKVPGARLPRPGDTISLYGSNFQTEAAGALVQNAQALTPLPVVKIGGVTAQVTYAGLVSAGLFQINIVVPNVPDGEQPVTLTYSGTASENTALLSVHH